MKNKVVSKFSCLGFGAFYTGFFIIGGDANAAIISNIFIAALFIINAGEPNL